MGGDDVRDGMPSGNYHPSPQVDPSFTPSWGVLSIFLSPRIFIMLYRLLTWLSVVLLCLPLVLGYPHSFGPSKHLLEKRRIGHRLPNILHPKSSHPDGQHEISKRRIGLRLPNIIYLRPDQEKKSIFW